MSKSIIRIGPQHEFFCCCFNFLYLLHLGDNRSSDEHARLHNLAIAFTAQTQINVSDKNYTSGSSECLNTCFCTFDK